MDQDLKRISDDLRLPQDSRERIRAQLASCQNQKEAIPMKKVIKTRVPLIAAAVIMAMALTITAGAVASRFFRNDTIVASWADIPDPGESDGPAAVAISGPNGNPPFTLEEMIESDRFKSDGWSSKETIGGGGLVYGYNQWDDFELLDSKPALRNRRVTRADGAEKMEYTAGNPANLTDTLTGRLSFDLSWMGKHYDYIPDANFSYVVTDPEGGYVCELLSALYAKQDGSGYVKITLSNTVPKDNYAAPTYVIDGSYETAYYYTTPDGYEFLVKMDNGNVWADCTTNCTDVGLFGAYLSQDETEDILDNLQLSIQE